MVHRGLTFTQFRSIVLIFSSCATHHRSFYSFTIKVSGFFLHLMGVMDSKSPEKFRSVLLFCAFWDIEHFPRIASFAVWEFWIPWMFVERARHQGGVQREWHWTPKKARPPQSSRTLCYVPLWPKKATRRAIFYAPKYKYVWLDANWLTCYLRVGGLCGQGAF